MIYAMDTYEFFKRERREKSTKYVKTKVELDTETELLMVLCISSNWVTIWGLTESSKLVSNKSNWFC